MDISLLKEETPYSKGTALVSKRFGNVRVCHIYENYISIIIGDKPIGSSSDAWCTLGLNRTALYDFGTDDEVTLRNE